MLQVIKDLNEIRKENGKLSKITYFVDECFQFYFTRVTKFKFCNLNFFKFLGNEDCDTVDNVAIASRYRSFILYIYTVN